MGSGPTQALTSPPNLLEQPADGLSAIEQTAPSRNQLHTTSGDFLRLNDCRHQTLLSMHHFHPPHGPTHPSRGAQPLSGW
jgi:hypothetical protein